MNKYIEHTLLKQDATKKEVIKLRLEIEKLEKFLGGVKNMKELLAMEDRPTAIFMSNYETALGGVMADAADNTYIQLKTLNSSKGPAVRALRAQSDKKEYIRYMRNLIESIENIKIKQ